MSHAVYEIRLAGAILKRFILGYPYSLSRLRDQLERITQNRMTDKKFINQPDIGWLKVNLLANSTIKIKMLCLQVLEMIRND